MLRTVNYEKEPLLAGDAWYAKGTGIASNQGPGDDGEYDNQHIDNIRTKLLNYGYTLVDQIYDPSATAAMVATALNQGRSIINYCGHGIQNGWGIDRVQQQPRRGAAQRLDAAVHLQRGLRQRAVRRQHLLRRGLAAGQPQRQPDRRDGGLHVVDQPVVEPADGGRGRGR